MKKTTAALLLFALLGCAALVPAFADEMMDDEASDMVIDDEGDEYEDVELDENRAILIAQKFVMEDTVIQGRNMSIKIVFHNVGKGYVSSDGCRTRSCALPYSQLSACPL